VRTAAVVDVVVELSVEFLSMDSVESTHVLSPTASVVTLEITIHR
jgi:hypothetical protein